MNAILAYIKREPVVLLDAVKAILALVVILGLPVPAGLDVALAGVLVTILTIATRGMVTPVPKEEADELDILDEEEPVEEVVEEEVPAEDPIEEAPDAVPRDEELTEE